MSVIKCELLHLHVAAASELHGRRGLAEQALIGKILTHARDTAEIHVPREVILQIPGRSRLAHLAEMVEDRSKQDRRTLPQVANPKEGESDPGWKDRMKDLFKK